MTVERDGVQEEEETKGILKREEEEEGNTCGWH